MECTVCNDSEGEVVTLQIETLDGEEVARDMILCEQCLQELLVESWIDRETETD